MQRAITLSQMKVRHGAKDMRDFRPNAAKRGYGSKWQKARATYLQRNPNCVECAVEGHIEAAVVVDHIVPHKGNMNVFWDKHNWQSLCEYCHNRKTVKQDGGFGNT